jgi:death-on-curing family protein
MITTFLLAAAWVLALVIAALVALPSKMIGDELRARVDDLPVLFVRLALRQLPEDMRAYYEPDWIGNVLAAFNDETAKYPVTRFVRSFRFGFSLLLGSRQIRKETKVAFPTIHEKAAALLHGLARTHPFIDGNKRTAWAATAVFYRANGYRVRAEDDDIVALMVDVAEGQMDVQHIAGVLKHYWEFPFGFTPCDPMTRYLTVDDVQAFNAHFVGDGQLRDFGLLDSAVFRPQATHFGEDNVRGRRHRSHISSKSSTTPPPSSTRQVRW